MKDLPLKERLQPCVPLRFPGFEQQYQYEIEAEGETLAYNFNELDCREWYQSFADRVIESVNEGKYLPLYRMGDGEYLFALKKNPEGDEPFWKLSFYDMGRRVYRILKGDAQRGGWSDENYTVDERLRAHEKFVNGIKMVSKNGVLALGLHDSPLYERYIPDIFDWFDKKDIHIDESNYIHVYAVYALMNGVDHKRLLKGRNVLIVTGIDPERKRRLRRGLHNRNVDTVDFLPISKKKSMIDNIDTSTVSEKIDLVLIAAGIGTVNVLSQLRELRVPQLDIGFCMDIIANPELRWERPFCVPDTDFDVNKIKY